MSRIVATTEPQVLVLGEAVADVVVRGESAPTMHAGGSPANVAYGLGRLGRSVALITELAADPYGALIRDHLESAGVDVRAARPATGRTPSATAVLDDTGAARYTFDLSWDLEVLPRPPVAPHLHLGSVGAFVPPGADVAERVALDVHGRATVSLDPNIRPDLLRDRRDVVGRLDRLLACADVVKASDEDIAWLHPGLSPIEVALDWLEMGPSLVVVTRGSEGSVGVTHAATVVVPATRVDVVDTVGAGDAYMSALIDGLAAADLLGAARRPALRALTAAALRTLLERASRAAAITVARSGAQPPTRAELDVADLPTSAAPLRG